ncbi:TetR/AcrR family transcriptional regulator [Nocardia camponoti]|uniref:HTH tetR-type domain-containing protein n=1 Tax=Nocardia camponoti TaxID=1616106 RepID=A0A917QPZ7_9NOCA|nr:TetR/AcrR family transcriptional regulator [Nocardia camponoti]GGK62441.1 hypothetical protein GCM10011591_38310 [Nocardia camponoti]
MPKVSDEHLERRREQILDAAQRCFARKGFHDTSMQDIFSEAELSAGAVYRYFTSKNAIIAELVRRTMLPLRAKLATIITEDPLPSPGEVVAMVTREIVKLSANDGPLCLAPQAWALAMVQPDANIPVREGITAMREVWRDYGVRLRDAGRLPADADVDAFAKTILGVLPGFILQHLIVGDIEPDDFARGIAVLFPDKRD